MDIVVTWATCQCMCSRIGTNSTNIKKNIFTMVNMQNISTLRQGTIDFSNASLLNMASLQSFPNNVGNPIKFLITHGSVTSVGNATGVSGTIEQGTIVTIIMEVIRAVVMIVVVTMEIHVQI